MTIPLSHHSISAPPLPSSAPSHPSPHSPEEAIYLLPSPDRVTIIFSTVFKEETDRIFGRVFLQEFVDARRRPSCQTAPQVLYSNREPPLEIRHLGGLADGENVGYVTFGSFLSPFSLRLSSLTPLFRQLQSSSPATFRPPKSPFRPSPKSNSSATTFTTTSSAPRLTCTRG